ncbi:LOW QUALITY PROTEIN: Endosulfine domain-containing protein [Cephalotus follicularis]|uniref:Endosulfine domain-containing protein n=1 Tax=Cephalotus follicularis TaxID=3775 RepID=A0A1Q3CXZ2_CEPFO|nr:LOW QUALITY PROTEIN: Endosulfine domain-containing protein [Cephalotus follicularis]
MSDMEDVKEQNVPQESEKSMASSEEEEAAVKKRYGGLMPKKPPLISKVTYDINLTIIYGDCWFVLVFYDEFFFKKKIQDHERAYFDSADWALGKQGVEKPKGPLEALRPKLQPTQQQTRYRKSPYAPSDGEDGGSATSEDAATNE